MPTHSVRQVSIMALAPAPGVTTAADSASASSLGGLTLLRLQLFGTYRLADETSTPCRTLEIDPNQITLCCKPAGRTGDPIDLTLDLLGKLHGVIDGQMAAGLRVNVGNAYQDHIAQKLVWFKSCLGDRTDPADGSLRERRAPRIVPDKTGCSFIDPDGRVHQADILNISASGAALRTSYEPMIGAPIRLGEKQRRGLTVRRFEGGFAIAFLEQIPAAQFGSNMRI